VIGVQVRDEHASQLVEFEAGVGEGVQRAEAAVDLVDVVADLQRGRDSGFVRNRWWSGLDAECDERILR
jgi:hypothetical protein